MLWYEGSVDFKCNISLFSPEDIVSEQLAQEHMLVLDLQQQLKSAQLTQRVVDEVEELVKVLSVSYISD